MPLHFDVNDCMEKSNLTDDVWGAFASNPDNALYSPFEGLCNWLYGTKFRYGNRKRDCIMEDNLVIFEEKHIDQVIEAGLFSSPDIPTQIGYLKCFIGLKVWAN